MKMKPLVSSSPLANEQEGQAPVIQCGVTSTPVDTCTKSAVTCATLWNGQANTACEDSAMQVDNSELMQNGQVGTCPENGVERLGANEVDVSSGQGTGPTVSPENGVERLNANEPDVTSVQGTRPADNAVAVGTGEDRQRDKEHVDSEYADGGLPCDEDEDLDEQLEAAYGAGVTVDSVEDNPSPEDWETEIVPPFFIVPHKAYLYGKKVFVPSDLHAPTVRRRPPQFQAVHGQFDDCDT
ncbi:uncharacterized protein LOC119179576 [Rhipicephalus microplus]|uniref:Protein ovary overexpressed n=1 Tax=Rhipicephalus microplus TaxID=6941 RepID=A0A6M2CPP0_RHIMP